MSNANGILPRLVDHPKMGDVSGLVFELTSDPDNYMDWPTSVKVYGNSPYLVLSQMYADNGSKAIEILLTGEQIAALSSIAIDTLLYRTRDADEKHGAEG